MVMMIDDDDAYTLRRVDPLSLPVEDQLLKAKYVISCARKGRDRVRDCLLWMMWMLLWVTLASSLWMDGRHVMRWLLCCLVSMMWCDVCMSLHCLLISGCPRVPDPRGHHRGEVQDDHDLPVVAVASQAQEAVVTLLLTGEEAILLNKWKSCYSEVVDLTVVFSPVS